MSDIDNLLKSNIVESDRFSYTVVDTGSKRSNHYDGVVHGVNYSSQDDGFRTGRKKGFYTSLNETFNLDIVSGMLFPAVLYNIPGLLVFERPPAQKFVEYLDRPVDYINDSTSSFSYVLPLPWQLYVAEYDVKTMLLCKVHMYFMKESFKNSQQTMYMPPLPNFYANGMLCRPFFPLMDDVEGYGKTLSGVMASTYDWVWNSGFNHDLMECVMTVYSHRDNSLYDKEYTRYMVSSSIHRHIHPKDVCKVLSDWEKISVDNILEIKWPNLSVTNLWDSEIEWFYEYEQDYPYGGGCQSESGDLEEYSNDYPMKIYNVEKTFSIMMKSVIEQSDTYTSANRPKFISYDRRFSNYHSLSVQSLI